MKQIILTGSSSGFGLLAAKTLASKGHKVYATMRNVSTSNAAIANQLKEWAQQQQVQLEVVEMDVASTPSVKKAVDEIAKRSGGKIDVLINNAGLAFIGFNESLTIEQTEQMYQVNTIGPERVMKAVLPYMHAQKEGLVINVTSVLSRLLLPSVSTYNGTKAALDAVTLGYHYELKSAGIDVVSIQPGAYQTTDLTAKGMVGANSEAEKNYAPDAIDFRRALTAYFEPTPQSGNPQEVADAMLHLVEQPKGQRALWTVVGGGANTEAVQTLNHTLQGMTEGVVTNLPHVFPAK